MLCSGPYGLPSPDVDRGVTDTGHYGVPGHADHAVVQGDNVNTRPLTLPVV